MSDIAFRPCFRGLDKGTTDLRKVTAQMRRTEKQENNLLFLFAQLKQIMQIREALVLWRGNGSVIKTTPFGIHFVCYYSERSMMKIIQGNNNE